jgi:hypothetical protein
MPTHSQPIFYGCATRNNTIAAVSLVEVVCLQRTIIRTGAFGINAVYIIHEKIYLN